MKVYQTRKQSDMTEGKGFMVTDKTFLHLKHAEEYIDSKPGVMGRKAKWSEEKFGDWAIVEIEVIEYSFLEHEKAKKAIIEKAISKLTDEEILLLGVDVNNIKKKNNIE